MDDRPLSIRARKKVKAQLEKQERDRMLHFFQKRMELARNGAVAFREGKTVESLRNYHAYLEILEKVKGVGKGGLSPKHFDPKKDIAEMLLLSGVFWDLSKIHDRSGKKSLEKLDYYLDRFVLFSKGMPFQHVSAELLRKYLVGGLPRHRTQFKDAHVRLGGGKCFIATAVEDYCAPETLPALRHFRDHYLLKSASGTLCVRFYYWVGPTLARIVLRCPLLFQKAVALVLDRIGAKITFLLMSN